MKGRTVQTTRIRTDYLRSGMITVQYIGGKPRIDEVLRYEVYHGACKGRHFLTADRRNVCYLNGGIVDVLVSDETGTKRTSTGNNNRMPGYVENGMAKRVQRSGEE